VVELLKKLEEYKKNPPDNYQIIQELVNTLYEVGKEVIVLKAKVNGLIPTKMQKRKCLKKNGK